MKVVLFCGGQGLRIREHSETIPKPMVTVGWRPILWHVMRYYAHFGMKDFILCLGYRADAIKDYFLRYSEAISNDFVMADGVPLSAATLDRKIDHLMAALSITVDRSWYSRETFRGLARIRGIEAGAADGYAEGFTASKIVVNL